MSRILRRPMFRGGRVNSDGVGITSGLNKRPGYATGVGPVVVTGRQLLDQAMRSNMDIGSINPRSLFSITPGSQYYDLGKAAAFDVEQYPPVTSKESNISSSLSDFYTMQDQTGSEIPNNLIVSKDITDLPSGVTSKKKTYYDDMPKVDKEENKSQVKNTGTNEVINKGTRTEFNEDDDSDSITLSDAEKAKKEYADLLGLEKARMQDAYDMLIRFGGAKGTNFREVAQDFLASEAKAGPSRTEKIKEAAGTLAIKEQIESKQLDKRIAAALAKGTDSTDFTRMVQMLKDPNLDRRTKSVIISKMGWQPSLESQINKLKQEGSVTSATVDEIAGIYIPNYKGILTASAKNDGVYLDSANKKLITLKGGQVVGTQSINY